MVSKQAKMFHLKLYSGAPHKMQKERCIVQITHTWASTQACKSYSNCRIYGHQLQLLQQHSYGCQPPAASEQYSVHQAQYEA